MSICLKIRNIWRHLQIYSYNRSLEFLPFQLCYQFCWKYKYAWNQTTITTKRSLVFCNLFQYRIKQHTVTKSAHLLDKQRITTFNSTDHITGHTPQHIYILHYSMRKITDHNLYSDTFTLDNIKLSNSTTN